MTRLVTINQNYQKHKEQYPESFRLRMHRALSWLNQAEQTQDLDTKFIFLWVSFNAIYAKDLALGVTKDSFAAFINDICQLDLNHEIYDLVWQRFPQNIRVLLDNKYTFQPFWDYQNGLLSAAAWQEDFQQNKKRALQALETQDTGRVLSVVFRHLYTLRNQIIHGGATFGSSANREQVKDGCQILSYLLPEMIQVMLDDDQKQRWGRPYYPYVQD